MVATSGNRTAGGQSGQPWVVPPPLATAELRTADGTPITLRRYGNLDGRRIIMSHGNGFAVDAYFPFWSLFLDRFDVVIFDCRNTAGTRSAIAAFTISRRSSTTRAPSSAPATRTSVRSRRLACFIRCRR